MGYLGNAEISDDRHTLYINHDVGGFDVAMDDTISVSVAQRFTHFGHYSLDHGYRELADLLDNRVERSPIHELHDEIEQFFGLFDRVNRNDMGMIERGCRSGLELEPLYHTVTKQECRQHDLDGHLAIQLYVMREEDGGHSAGSQLGKDLVLPQRSRAQSL